MQTAGAGLGAGESETKSWVPIVAGLTVSSFILVSVALGSFRPGSRDGVTHSGRNEAAGIDEECFLLDVLLQRGGDAVTAHTPRRRDRWRPHVGTLTFYVHFAFLRICFESSKPGTCIRSFS